MTRLSVNINKIATLRNARGGKNPNVVNVAKDCERFGAEGITIHPRPDERHITTQDVYDLAPIVTTEFNIEGYPDQRFLDLVKKNKPAQATLVPDPPGVLTSNAGWDTVQNHDFLKEIISELKGMGVRTSVFIGTEPKLIEYAAKVGTDRIELYTEPYAANYAKDRDDAVAPFVLAAKRAKELGLGINAGHDLSLENLKFLKEKIPFLDEVSIGHALVCDALYFGLENSIQLYLRELREA
ncbi:pyridoxine 5'-phosphate synthase [uncultured Marivirga sp.]|uniref:pyridoxine 5'-phosphate synthase n=1 Tax=uncultured Marivirga sp. TaxID=1123707 RepID=UPI0030EE24D8|tara:strand:- start:57761 stop:58480 length:720 start_codon:yes stop_codon:yes gene_type:complete